MLCFLVLLFAKIEDADGFCACWLALGLEVFWADPSRVLAPIEDAVAPLAIAVITHGFARNLTRIPRGTRRSYRRWLQIIISFVNSC